MRSLVMRVLLLVVVVLVAVTVTALRLFRLDVKPREGFGNPDQPEADAEAAAEKSESAPTESDNTSNAPIVEAPLDIEERMDTLRGDSMYAPNAHEPQASSKASDPLLRLLSALTLEAVDRDARNFMEKRPTLLQRRGGDDGSSNGDAQSAAAQGLSTDQPIRKYLDRASEAVTDWKSLAEHALQERDLYRSGSDQTELPSFTSEDLVLDPSQRWRVPERRAPVCIVSDARAAKVCPGTDQSSLIGTLLTDAQHTAVGSIMPKFVFNQIDG